MTVLWEINFIRAIDGEQKIMFTRAYENGLQKKVSIGQEKEIFITYISVFPSKDIVRIKLGIEKQYLYSFYYFDKTTYDRGFLGVFGVSEYGTSEPYDWQEIEFIAKFVFAEYYKRLEDGRILSPEGSQDYLNWLDSQIKENYAQFCCDREDYYKSLSIKKQTSLSQTFQTIAACTEKKETKLNKSKSLNGLQIREITPKEIEAASPKKAIRIREITQAEHEAALPFQHLEQNDKLWLNLIRSWEFQLLNSFGNPLTKILSFQNGEQKEWGSEEEQNMQSLMGMSYSVLRSFVEQQKLKLQNMKVRYSGGIEFILFRSFNIGSHQYLLIMNVNNFNTDAQMAIDVLKGDEDRTIDSIVDDLSQNHKDWFTEKGEYSDPKISREVENLFYRHCRNAFRSNLLS